MSTLQFTVGWLNSTKVDSVESFCEYIQQSMGTPYPTVKMMPSTRKTFARFFEQYPKADWQTLCKTVDYCRAKKKRLAQAYSIVSMVRFAWRDGFLPELDPNVDKEVDAAIAAALEVETDREWRKRLMLATSVEGKQIALREWGEARG